MFHTTVGTRYLHRINYLNKIILYSFNSIFLIPKILSGNLIHNYDRPQGFVLVFTSLPTEKDNLLSTAGVLPQ